MKAFIQHESRGRLRVRMHQYRMSLEQADLLEAYLLDQPGVKSAAVHERTCCATVCYTGSRAGLLHAIGRFDYRSPAVTALAPQHSGRALNREYQEKLVTMVAVKAACTLFLPTPLQIVRTVCMAAPFLCRGLRRLLRGQLRVDVLDALSIGVSMARRDFGTAGSVMFLLQLGELLEEWTHKKLVVADLGHLPAEQRREEQPVEQHQNDERHSVVEDQRSFRGLLPLVCWHMDSPVLCRESAAHRAQCFGITI